MSGLAGSQIVVLSSIDWDAAWQRHQIFASQFARAGHDVFFVENSGFRTPGLKDAGRVGRRLSRLWRPARKSPEEAPPRLKVVAPRVLPPGFRRSNAALLIPALLRQLKAAGLGPRPVVIVYLATATTLELLRRLEPSFVLYDCASNFRDHPDAPPDFMDLERALLGRSQLVVCDSAFLYRQKVSEHPRVVQIHQGVDESFLETKPPSGSWRDFCYYGTWSKDLDPAPLAALCDAGFPVTVSGFVKEPAPSLPERVRRLEPIPRKGLPARLESFDGFLMPYRINPFLLGVVPAKIYECLALGRPVLAAPLPSLEPFRDLLYFAGSTEEWVRIARRLPETETPRLRQERRDLAREHTYAREFARLVEQIEGSWPGALYRKSQN